MPITLTDLGKTEPFDQLLVALVGVEKSGKSRTAATARKPVLFYDWDGRAASIAGIKDVYAMTIRDELGFNQPTGFSSFLSSVTQLEQSGGDLRSIGFDVPEGTIVRSIVLDSMIRMAKSAQRYILSVGGKGVTRSLQFGSITVRFPGGFDAWNAEMAAVEDALLKVIALGKDTYAVFHETPEEAPDSTVDKPLFTGRVGLFPVRYQRLIGYFNEVWRVERGAPMSGSAQSAVPKIITTPTYEFKNAASAMLLDTEEAPNIEAMIAKHIARQSGNFTPAVMPPVSDKVPPSLTPARKWGTVVTEDKK